MQADASEQADKQADQQAQKQDDQQSRLRQARFQNAWAFTRTLTIDLLNSLSDEDLLLSPGTEVGQFWKQFRHIGRVQEDYMDALVRKSISFSVQNKHYSGGPNKAKLLEYLAELDRSFFIQLQTIDFNEIIDWFGEEVGVGEHLSRLMSHEILHHGQFIVYCQLLKKKYPESWAVWGF